MTLTYAESATLMTDTAFGDRVKTAVLVYANIIMDEYMHALPPLPSAPQNVRWAQVTRSNPDAIARQIQPSVVMDPLVQSEGASITDTDLQTSVQNAVNAYWHFPV